MSKKKIQTGSVEEKQIIELYLNGLSASKCGKMFNISESVTLDLLQRNNIKRRNQKEAKNGGEEKENIVINLYNSGKSIRECAKHIGLSCSYVNRVLHNNKIPIKSRQFYAYKLKRDYFENIDSKDKAYFLGLLMADGGITTQNSGIKLSLQDRDVEILETFKKYLDFEGEIANIFRKNKNHRDMKCLTAYSYQLVYDLSKYGVVQNKSHKTYFPDIPEEFYSHFIRGVFDGDGCIGIDKKTKYKIFCIVGNNKLIIEIQNKLVKNCGLNFTKLLHKSHHKENIIYVQYGGTNNIKKIYDYLYKDCDDLYLKRKKEKFEK